MEQNLFLDRGRLEAVEELVERLAKSIDIDGLKEKNKALTEKTMEPGFWDDSEAAQKVIREQNALKSRTDVYDELNEAMEESAVMLELMEEEDDFSFYDQFKKNLDVIEKRPTILKSKPF